MARKCLARPLIEFGELFKDYNEAKHRLLLFDYDGTLTHIVNDPATAIPSLDLLSRLNELSRPGSKNTVWIISGRDRNFFDLYFGDLNVGFIAEHGCFLKPARSSMKGDEWINLAANEDMRWKMSAVEWLRFLKLQINGSTYEEKEYSVVWHYRNVELHNANQTRIAMALEAIEHYARMRPSLQTMKCKRAVEVRPRLASKGNIVAQLLDTASYDFIMCAGDDVTDEDMFRPLAILEARMDKTSLKLYTCHVGYSIPNTMAKYTLKDDRTLRNLLRMMSTIDDMGMVPKNLENL